MRVEGLLLAALVVFFVVVGAVYGFVSHEPAGTVALLFTAGLAALSGFYILFTGHRIGERPEDRKDGEIGENAGELGFFSPHSYWPLALGASVGLVALGLAIGWWLVALAALPLFLSILGFVFEYYRGEHAH